MSEPRMTKSDLLALYDLVPAEQLAEAEANWAWQQQRAEAAEAELRELVDAWTDIEPSEGAPWPAWPSNRLARMRVAATRARAALAGDSA